MTEQEAPEVAKPKHLVLQEMMAVLFKHDPVGLKPQVADEYESEALSVLARFNEASIHLAENEEDAVTAALTIVSQTFSFWFDNLNEDINFENVMLELLHVYVSSYPLIQGDDSTPDQEGVHVIINDRNKNNEFEQAAAEGIES
jgi:hypothetical protein